jgi:uncharacterized protein YlxW (UPF0749 family)
MSLLVDLMAEVPDPAYAAAAARRRAADSANGSAADSANGSAADSANGSAADSANGSAAGAVASNTRRPAVLVVLLLVLGLLVGVAIGQTRRRAPAAEVRRALAADVRGRTASNDALERRVAELRAALARTRNDSLTATSAGAALRERLAVLEQRTGAVAVTGPGVRVVLDDAPAGRTAGDRDRAGTDAIDPGRVVDRDLQDVVNGLWAAGAEAVAINGKRLTSQSAIREAGEAILVDFRPLSPPYRIAAIGDRDRLAPRFADSVTGRRFRTYAATYGLRFDVQPRDALRLPAASTLLLRRAGVAAEGTP